MHYVKNHGAWRAPSDTGQFSLAGAQPKTALLYDGQRYGVPAGRTPTTHILKPPLPELDGHPENEHLCLGLARALGLPSASSAVQQFDGEIAIVIERYDRMRQGTRWRRIHQEDGCQALSVLPTAKYQTEGGPGAKQLIELFPRLHPHKLKLAMKIGGTYRIREIDRRRWQAFAREVHIDDTALIVRAHAMADALPVEFVRLRKQAIREGLKHPALGRLQQALEQQAARCAASLG